MSEVTHPTRANPQTRKANNDLTSFVKTLGRVARFHPNKEDRGGWTHSKNILMSLVPWHRAEMLGIRDELYTDKMVSDLLGTTRETLAKYHPDNWGQLSAKKRKEAQLAWVVLEKGNPITRAEVESLLMGADVMSMFN